MPVWLRYCLFKTPELLAIACVAWGLVRLDWVSWYWAAAVFALCVGKDAVLYPWVRSAYGVEPSTMVGAERLLQSRGIATEDLAPEGFVRICGELWQARTADGAALAKGTPVRVESVNGLRLVVSRAPDAGSV